MEEYPWKESASLIFASKCDDRDNFKLLMTKRSKKSSFLSSAFVFPGGQLELNDFSCDWWQVFKNSGFSKEDVLSVRDRIKGTRPPIITKNQTVKHLIDKYSYEEDNSLPVDIALRICAIRETFEETGILLICNHNKNTKLSGNYTINTKICLNKWRAQINNTTNTFINLCYQLNCSPNIWDLKEWWNWLTPNITGHRRFDTMFYIYLSDYQPDVLSDGHEISKVEFYAVLEILDQHDKGNAVLPPPQIYELSRLNNFQSYQHLKLFSERRETLGCYRWTPYIINYRDGIALVLPGDAKYPDGKEENDFNSSLITLEEGRNASHLNRIELKMPLCRAYCTIKLTCGHYSPVTFTPIHPSVRSSL